MIKCLSRTVWCVAVGLSSHVAIAQAHNNDQVAAMSIDTGAFAPGHRDFTPYTTPGMCRAAAFTSRHVLWRTLAAQGKHDEALAIARTASLEHTGAEDLALLAETARHVGEVSTEEDALLLIRRRFAGTARAALAAFALGRLEFDKRHAHEKAAQWFGIYLKEQPRGPLAREARGRLIEASLEAGDRDRARKLAAEYLASYPSGPHATLARGLIDEAER